jgi:hypothetical protein
VTVAETIGLAGSMRIVGTEEFMIYSVSLIDLDLQTDSCLRARERERRKKAKKVV